MNHDGDNRQQILRRPVERERLVGIACSRLPSLVHARVRRSCRMLPAIADSVSHYLDPAFKFTGYRMPATLPSGLTHVEVDTTTEVAALASTLRDLLAEYEAEDIVVLSPFASRGSLAARVLRGSGKTPDETWLRKQLANEGGAGRVRWFSISKFNGLDADAVLVTDINDAAREWVESTGHSWDDFRYVAGSRAQYRAVVLEGAEAMLASGVQEQFGRLPAPPAPHLTGRAEAGQHRPSECVRDEFLAEHSLVQVP